MIRRNLHASLTAAAAHYPVITVTGPRQSGKTTLVRAAFPHLDYISLEPIDTRQYALEDPRGFLDAHRQGAIFDEVQRTPALLSYLQVEVDARPTPGRFVLTGSQHFGLSRAISQSLAGRTAVRTLLPLSLAELWRFEHAPRDLLEVLWCGAYPAIHDRQVPASMWLSDYITTYVQRDVREVLNVTDLNRFVVFLGLAAGRTASLLNLSSLGADTGISHNTARAWLSVLETSHLLELVLPWHKKLKKQLTRSPKMHFLDSGVVCQLLGIRSPEELRRHPLRGAIFESWVASELRKQQHHLNHPSRLFHFRDHRGLEVDLVQDHPEQITLIEAKSGATVSSDAFKALERVSALLVASGERRPIQQQLVYGGQHTQRRSAGRTALPWSEISSLATRS